MITYVAQSFTVSDLNETLNFIDLNDSHVM